MTGRKLWYFVTLCMLAMLPLAGCGSSGGSAVTPTPVGSKVSVDGTVGEAAKTSLFAAKAATGTIKAINITDGKELGTASVDSNGNFTGLSFTMASAKETVVLVATVGDKTYRLLLPVDLSAQTSALSTPIKVLLNSASTDSAKQTALELGLTGEFGDAGMIVPAGKTWADVVAIAEKYGVLTLASTASGIKLIGTVSTSSLLPAKAYVDFTADDVLNVKLGGEVSSAFIPATNKPVINVTVTNAKTGKGISGLPASKFTVHFAQLKADGSTWLNYKLETAGASRDRENLPGTISGNTVIDKGDGSYTIILNLDVTKSNAYQQSQRDDATKDGAKLTYDASLVHRAAISVNATGAINPATNAAQASNPNNVAGLVYDFIPATGAVYVNPNGGNYARDIVTMAACDSCHGPLVNHGHHFGSRPDTKICVTCHTVQNKRTGMPAVEFTNMIHTFHMGHDLPDKSEAKVYLGGQPKGGTYEAVNASHLKYPQDQRNCAKCHTGKDSIKQVGLKPTQFACASCHNDGTKTHITTNKVCSECHAAGFGTAHLTPVKTANNSDLPSGVASFTYELSSATLNVDKQPVFKFRIKKDGVAITSFAAASTVIRADNARPVVAGTYEPIPNYAGGPTFYAAYAVLQDGITKPIDFNTSVSGSLASMMLPVGNALKTGTITGPDADGFFTATLTHSWNTAGTVATAIAIPADANMLTFVMNGNFTQKNNVKYPYTVADYSVAPVKSATGGLPSFTLETKKVATGYTGRRAVVTMAKCNDCHEQLGTKPVFHGGGRQDPSNCQMCHTPNRANNGWAVNSSTFVHGLHGASKRTVPYTWHKEIEADGTVGWSGEAIGYPGVLRNCEQCHVAGGYDYTTYGSQVDNMLYTTVASGTADGTSTPSKKASMSPYVITATDYGTAGTATNLVNSPISAACFSCHDTAAAKSHMVSNGGSIYETRATALLKKESCLICHGPRGADTTLPVTGAVPTIKTVHRWW